MHKIDFLKDLRQIVARKLDNMGYPSNPASPAGRCPELPRISGFHPKRNYQMKNKDNQSQSILYQADDGQTKLQVKLEDETVWLTQDQMAELFDILKKEKMTRVEEQKIKLAAKALLHRLVEEQPKILVQDWWKDMQSQEKVKSAIDDVLDSILPETFNKGLFQNRSGAIFNLAYEYASKGLKWAG